MTDATHTQASIREIQPTDRDDWNHLWTQYLSFYKTTLPNDVFDAGFARLLSRADNEYKGLIAEQDGVPVGLAHYLFHRDMWSIEDSCYLEDLFVVPDLRGGGVGRALIKAVRQCAQAHGCSTLYWHTQEFNTNARHLYDQVAQLTPFVKYETKTNLPEL